MYLKKNKDKENICVVHQHIGYKKDPSNKNRLIIDEKVADIVKLIFNMYENGTGSKKIVEYLNNKHYLSPSGYRKTGIVCDENKNNYNWNATTLCAMLENECYIGNTVQNKVTVVSYKVKKIRKVDETQYIRVENTHEAIIDKDMFEKVQTLHQKRAKVCEKQYQYLLKGLLYCKHCKWQLQVVLKVHHRSNREKIPLNKIEIDKDKNVFISFNFAPLNTICNNVDEFIELEQVIKRY